MRRACDCVYTTGCKGYLAAHVQVQRDTARSQAAQSLAQVKLAVGWTGQLHVSYKTPVVLDMLVAHLWSHARTSCFCDTLRMLTAVLDPQCPLLPGAGIM